MYAERAAAPTSIATRDDTELGIGVFLLNAAAIFLVRDWLCLARARGVLRELDWRRLERERREWKRGNGRRRSGSERELGQ